MMLKLDIKSKLLTRCSSFDTRWIVFVSKGLAEKTFNNLYTIKAGNRKEISQAELLHAMMSTGFRGVCRHNHFKGFEYADDEMIFDIITDI